MSCTCSDLSPCNIINKICSSVETFANSETGKKIGKIAKQAFLILAGAALFLIHTKVFFAAFVIGYVLSSKEEAENEKPCHVTYLLTEIKDFYTKHPFIAVTLTIINAIHAIYAAHILASMALGREVKRGFGN